MHKPANASETIKALGGYKGTMALFNVSRAAVGNWTSRGFPHRVRLTALKELKRRGVRVDDCAFEPAAGSEAA